MDDRRLIDLDRYLRTKVRILNDSGGRGYDTGVRTFSCPLCRDNKGRGWINVAFWTAGCFNVGCDACERLPGGALEWAKRVEGETSRTWTFIKLKNEFGVARPIEYKPLPQRGDDFVRWPEGVRWFKAEGGGPMQRTFELFCEKQWSITRADAVTWGLGYCMTGFYSQRVIIPIVMNGEPVAFQARALVKEPKKPKYITSRHGPKDDPKAECFRAANAILYNYDRIKEGGDVVLVEGVGDVMGWHKGNPDRQPTAVAMLGLNMTPEKIGLLMEKNPARVIVAGDNEPEAQKQVEDIFTTLRDGWGLSVTLGGWDGGKDAGSGARLIERTAPTLRDRIQSRLAR